MSKLIGNIKVSKFRENSRSFAEILKNVWIILLNFYNFLHKFSVKLKIENFEKIFRSGIEILRTFEVKFKSNLHKIAEILSKLLKYCVKFGKNVGTFVET